MFVWRCYVYHPRLQVFTTLSLLDLKVRTSAEDLGKQTAVPGVKMLHHHDSGRKIRGKRSEDFT